MAGRNPTPAKRELAQYKALNDAGLTPNAVAVRMKRDPKTIRKYLQSDIYNSDPEITAMVDAIKKEEIAYLYFFGVKSPEPRHSPIQDKTEPDTLSVTAA